MTLVNLIFICLVIPSSTWSSYKHENTMKVLLDIAPQGIVSFMSEAWGGRVIDRYLTNNSGILNYLLPGNVVLADQGFDSGDSVGMMQTRLHIPAFACCALNNMCNSVVSFH